MRYYRPGSEQSVPGREGETGERTVYKMTGRLELRCGSRLAPIKSQLAVSSSLQLGMLGTDLVSEERSRLEKPRKRTEPREEASNFCVSRLIASRLILPLKLNPDSRSPAHTSCTCRILRYCLSTLSQ